MVNPESLDLEKMNIDAEALNCMAQGKRHLLVQDYNSAVQSLEEACKLYDAKYGISADECADAYMNYGHALFELHRQESGVIDGLIDPADKGSDNDEEDEEADEEIEDDELNGDQSVDKENGKSEIKEEDISESPKPEEKNGDLAEPGTSLNGNSNDKQMDTDVDPNQPSTSTGITDNNRIDDEDDAAISNIEVAFEVLTMAKLIYQRQTEYRDDAFLKLSDTLQRLGEILIEWENNDDALKSLEECLEIRKKRLPDDDRLIAEAYYHIGICHSLNSNLENSNINFQKAIDVIDQRLTKLKNSYTTETDNDKKQKIEMEIKELDDLLPEMRCKIEENQNEVASNKIAEEDEKLEEEKIAEKKKQILDKPISNVTHLVKRKREEPAELDSNKKLKNSENGSNGNNVEMKE